MDPRLRGDVSRRVSQKVKSTIFCKTLKKGKPNTQTCLIKIKMPAKAGIHLHDPFLIISIAYISIRTIFTNILHAFCNKSRLSLLSV